MLVKIKFPKRCFTVNDKQEFIDELIEWGKENLNDQENWKYKILLLTFPKHLVHYKTKSISFDIENKADAMALKLMWCET